MLRNRIAAERKHKCENNLVTDTSHKGHMDDEAVHFHEPADAQIRRQQRDLEAKQGEGVDGPAGVLHLAERDVVCGGEVVSA